MRQILHIFKKDVRRFRYEIFVILAMTALFAFLGAHSQPAVTQYSQGVDELNVLYHLFLPLGWWYLIAAVIHEEALPGHQQFWLTRPYARTSLLGAKLLFIAAFVNLPVLLADCVIISAQGFPASGYLPNLLCRQILFSALWLLPFAALATVTNKLRQFFTALLTIAVLCFILLYAFGMGILFYWGRAAWIANSLFILILGIAALVILPLQYAKRRTAVARGIAICAGVLALIVPALLPPAAVYGFQLALSKSPTEQSPVHIAFDGTRERTRTWMTDTVRGAAEIDVPLEVTGIPKEADLISDYVGVTMESADGRSWRDVGRTMLYRTKGLYWLKVHVRDAVFEQQKNNPVTLRIVAHLTLLGNRRSSRLEAQAKAAAVPGLGLCSALVTRQRDWSMICRSPFRDSSLFALGPFLANESSDDTLSLPQGGSYSPYLAESGISPLVATFQGSITVTDPSLKAVNISTEAALGHFRCDFVIHDIHLAGYLVQ